MDISQILAALRAERHRIESAIHVLETPAAARATPSRGRRSAASFKSQTTAPRRSLSAAARKRISDMMKLRWAERRRGKKAA
jgi:hypothetical protein